MRYILLILMFLGLSNASHAESLTQIAGPKTDSIFVADEQVELTGALSGTVFMAAGEGRIDRVPSGQKLIQAAGMSRIQASTFRLGLSAAGRFSADQTRFQDLIQAGGEIELRKTHVTDSWIAAAGTLRTDATSEVQGDALLAGGTLHLDGTYGGQVRIAAGKVLLRGHFHGPVHIIAEKIEVLAGARFEQNLYHRSDKIEIAPDAQIAGEVVREGDLESMKWAGAGALVFGTVLSLIVLIGALFVGPLIALVFPQTTARAAARLLERPSESLGYGFLALLVVPAFLSLGFASVFATALALAAIPFVACGALIAVGSSTVFVAEAIHFGLKRRSGKKPRFTHELQKASAGTRFVWLLLAAFTLLMGSWVPVVGSIAALALFAGSVGALVSGLRK